MEQALQLNTSADKTLDIVDAIKLSMSSHPLDWKVEGELCDRFVYRHRDIEISIALSIPFAFAWIREGNSFDSKKLSLSVLQGLRLVRFLIGWRKLERKESIRRKSEELTEKAMGVL